MSDPATTLPTTPTRKRRRQLSDDLASTWVVPATPSRPTKPRVDYHPKASMLSNRWYQGKILSFQGFRPNGTQNAGPSATRPQVTSDLSNNPFLGSDLFDGFESQFSQHPETHAYEDLLKELNDMVVQEPTTS